MKLLDLVVRFFVGAEAGLPSGFHSSSGYSEGYVALTRQINEDYPETELTSEMVAAAIKKASPDRSSAQLRRVKLAAS
jgi:hypothetical protein